MTRGRRRVPVRAAVRALVLAVVVTGLAAAPVPVAARPQPLPDPPGLEPIIFVHGLHSTVEAFSTMRQRFLDVGVPEDRLWTFGYDSKQSNVVTAEAFGDFVAWVRSLTGAAHVDVVSHSMGAFSTRWCIRFGSCRRVVDDWVSLAGPNHGTQTSYLCALFSGEEGCPEIAVGSSFLQTLNAGDETPGQVDWTTIRSTDDEIVVPAASVPLAGAANIAFSGLTHQELVSDAAVFAKVAAVVLDGVDLGAPAVTPDAAAAPGGGPIGAEASSGAEAGEPAVLVTKLDVVPDSRRDVAFSVCRAASRPCQQFSLDDDRDPTRARRFRSAVAPGTYRVVAAVPPGWAASAVVCDPLGRGDPARSRAHLTLAAGERTTCTFTLDRMPTSTTTTTTTTSTTTTTTSTTVPPSSTTSTSTTSTTLAPAVPGNDDVAAALALVGATGTTRGTNRAATVEAGEAEHAESAAARTVWYRWTAGIDAALAVDTCASGFDTVLGVYAGPATGPTVAGLTEVGADDDSCGTGSRVRFTSTAGTTYYFAVGGFGGAEGDLVLRRALVGWPVSDRFAAASALAPAGGTLEVATGPATVEAGEPAHDGVAPTHSLWFTWTAPTDGPITFSTCGSDHDTVLAVYTGEVVDGLTRIAADDDTCELGARTGVLATAGTTYHVAVDGFHGATGTATLTWG